MSDLIRLVERVFLVVLSAGVILRIAPQVPVHPEMVLFLLSEIVNVVLILSQRRGEMETAAYPTAVAFLGTSAGLLVVPQGSQLVPEVVTTALIFSGASIALAAKLSLRRSFGIVPANRGVKRGGVYRFVRHPMYAGYIINQIGFLLLFFSVWNVAVYALAWLAFLARVIEEEKFLLNDPEYREYAGTVKSRLLPGIV